ncbi:protein FAM126B isoform X1 [Folsomia candida]|uniref:protein FAM126B isoform X1 n=1 Tax=Folsomia candida TaxID=158441 RepID=UPI000B8F9088|nr:protein FAM126B isoform X1 [Folsomia candida]
MTDQLVVELLTEWAKLSDNLLSGCDGLNDFSESILNNEDLFQAVTHVLEENDRFRSLYGDVIAVLFSLYRAPHGKLRVFSGQFIPSLIYVYLNQIHSQKKCVALETLLRGIFELELSFEEIIPASARIANVNLPSIYHDPGGVSTSWLSDNDLDRLNLKTVKTITRQALVLNDERIRAPQRLPLCVELWWIFNHRLPHMPKHSIPMHLKVITKLITQGFTPMNSQKLQPPVRIVLSSKLLIEMVQTAYFSAYNGSPTLAEQILDEISARANYQLWADALLACHAVQDYLKSSELPIQVEVSSFKKSIITNASFRTKKLPDDIPIIERTDSTEEPETPTPTSHLHGFKAKSKIPHILAKIKRNSVVVINEEGDVETLASPPNAERKKSIDATAV